MQPITFLQSLDALPEKQSETDRNVLRNKAWIAIGTSMLCLLLLHYLKFTSSFYAAIRLAEGLFDVPNHQWVFAIKRHIFSNLFGYVWWSWWHFFLFLVVPIWVVKKVFKEPLRNYGWQKGTVFVHYKFYILLILVLIAGVAVGSFNDGFANFYPFYKLAYRSWFDLLIWELLYLSQFVALEFFFRGFLLHSLRVPMGSLSIAVMCIPYMMIHFSKLPLEAAGAVFFGFALGVLALKSRSIWGGVMIHVSVALTMDVAAIIQTKGLPVVFFP